MRWLFLIVILLFAASGTTSAGAGFDDGFENGAVVELSDRMPGTGPGLRDHDPIGRLDLVAQVRKSGPQARVSGDLIDLYNEYQTFLKTGDPGAIQKPFKPSNRMMRVVGERIVIDAIAQDDAAVLLADLEALGLQNGAMFGAVVSGQLPFEAIKDLTLLKSLRFVRPAYATTNLRLK